MTGQRFAHISRQVSALNTLFYFAKNHVLSIFLYLIRAECWCSIPPFAHTPTLCIFFTLFALPPSIRARRPSFAFLRRHIFYQIFRRNCGARLTSAIPRTLPCRQPRSSRRSPQDWDGRSTPLSPREQRFRQHRGWDSRTPQSRCRGKLSCGNRSRWRPPASRGSTPPASPALTMLAVAIDGSDRVDHELGWQLEPWRNPRLARRASHPRTHLRHFETRLVEFSTSSPMDRPVHPAARPLARPSGSPSAKFPSETSFYGAFPNITWFAALTMAPTASFAISPCSIRIIFLPCQPICRQFDDLLQRHSA